MSTFRFFVILIQLPPSTTRTDTLLPYTTLFLYPQQPVQDVVRSRRPPLRGRGGPRRAWRRGAVHGVSRGRRGVPRAHRVGHVDAEGNLYVVVGLGAPPEVRDELGESGAFVGTILKVTPEGDTSI